MGEWWLKVEGAASGRVCVSQRGVGEVVRERPRA